MPTCFISIAAQLSGNLFVKQRYRCGDTEPCSPGRIMGTPELVNMFIVFPRVRIPISPLGARNAAPDELPRPRLDTDTACVSVVTTGRPSFANITPALYLCTACITLPSSPINNVEPCVWADVCELMYMEIFCQMRIFLPSSRSHLFV